VPILPLKTYWRLVILPKKIEQYLAGKLKPALIERIRSLQKNHRPEFPEALSDQAVDDMLALEPQLILDSLAVPEAQRDGPRRQLAAYRAALEVPADASLEVLCNLLAELRAASLVGKPRDVAGVFEELYLNACNLPGDAFFIGSIQGIADEAFVAYLRLVRELPAGSVATTASALKTATVRRIARLRSPFLYRLTQQLAHVFSDIGLPRDYETKRDTLAKAVRNALQPPATGA
jgi:hypothetical protein